MLTFSKQTTITAEAAAYRVAGLVRELHASINARIGDGLAHTGLTLPQLLLVKALGHNGPMTVSAIAAGLSVSKPTAVGIVARLERDGLVTRRRDPKGDRREVIVEFALESVERMHGIRNAVAQTLS
ncbi:MAG: MarR family transcriptional regulator, partial [Spirochaetales bacterium]